MPTRKSEEVDVAALLAEVVALRKEVAALKREVSKRPAAGGNDPRLDKVIEALSINPVMKRIVES